MGSFIAVKREDVSHLLKREVVKESYYDEHYDKFSYHEREVEYIDLGDGICPQVYTAPETPDDVAFSAKRGMDTRPHAIKFLEERGIPFYFT